MSYEMGYLDQDRSDDRMFLLVAVGLHVGLLIWNPTIFKSVWRAVNGAGDGISVVFDPPGIFPGLPARTLPAPLPRAFPRTPSAVMIPSVPKMSSPHIHSLHMSIPIPLTAPLGEEVRVMQAAPTIALPNASGENILVPVKPTLIEGKTRIQIANGITSNAPIGLRDVGSGHGGFPGAMPVIEEPDVQTSRPSDPAHANGPVEGPLANRVILRRIIPEYPTWAEEQGIVGSVRLYITVTKDGMVRSTIRITKTSGSAELDRLAVDALKQWRFSPIPSTEESSEWGIVTFFFSLARG